MKYRIDENVAVLLNEIEAQATTAKRAVEAVQAGTKMLRRILPDTVDTAVKAQIERLLIRMTHVPSGATVPAITAAQESTRPYTNTNMSSTVRDTLIRQVAQHGQTTNRSIRDITGARSVTVSIQVRHLIENGVIVRNDRTYLPGPNFVAPTDTNATN